MMTRSRNKETRITIAFIVGAGVMSASLLGFGMRYSRQQRGEVDRLTISAKERWIGQPAPVIWAVSSGDTLPMPPVPGKPVVLTFVEENCSACRRLFSRLHEANVTHTELEESERFVILLGPGDLNAWDELDSVFRVMRAAHSDSARGAYDVPGLPYIVWVDPARRIADVQVGYPPELDVRRILSPVRH